MRKRYVFFMAILSFVLLSIFGVSSFFIKEDETLLGVTFTVIVVLYLIVSFIIYLYFHFTMRKIKEKENCSAEKVQKTVVQTKFREEKLKISNCCDVLSVLLSFGIVFVLLI